MNITSSTVNSGREIVLRMLYLIPAPLLLGAFLLPIAALAQHSWPLFFASLLCVSSAVYLRHLGVKYWEFLRLDNDFEKLAQYPDKAKIENDPEIERVLAQASQWSNRDLTELDISLHFNSLGTSRHGTSNDPWRN